MSVMEQLQPQQHAQKPKIVTTIIPILDIIEQIDPYLIRKHGQGDPAAIAKVNAAINTALHLWSKHGWNILLQSGAIPLQQANVFLEELARAELVTPHDETKLSLDLFKAFYPYIYATYKTEPYFFDHIRVVNALGDDLILEISYICVY